MKTLLRFAPLALLPLGIALLNTGCYYDVAEELYPLNNPDSISAEWAADVAPIISSSCALPGCHVAGNGLPVLDNYNGVKATVDDGSLEDRAITLQDMPPAGPLPQGERDILSKWIADGAPEN